jgi:transcriptional regulator with XRE-family HTH domain
MLAEEIGTRARTLLRDHEPDVPQYEVASRIGMTPDALSRALSGKRAFSSIELARLADFLRADIHWLITGEPDPHRLLFAARHQFDHATGVRDVPGRDGDETILSDIELAYRQAGQLPPSTPIPASAQEARTTLGDDFVLPFVERLQQRLHVDVVRVAGLSTSYCFTVDGRHVIVVPATGNWFFENWCIAHELGHLGAKHLDGGSPGADPEAVANSFAADLLLPADEIRATDFEHIDAARLADFVWQKGVSTEALARRLAALRAPVGDLVEEWAGQPTQRLLRRHWRAPDPALDAITDRMNRAALRHFPLELQEAHVRRVASGELGKETLAWMLAIPADDLGIDTPPVPAADVNALAAELGLTPVS